MLREVTDPIPTAEDAARKVYQRIVSEAADEGITHARAASDTADEVARLIDLGEVQAPNVRDALLHTVKRIDTAQGQTADKIIERLSRGEVHLFEDSDLLATVVTLGSGNRKSWEHITATDLSDMDAERRKNYRSVKDAMDRWESSYSMVLPVVMAHRTVGAAVRSGAFTKEATA